MTSTSRQHSSDEFGQSRSGTPVAGLDGPMIGAASLIMVDALVEHEANATPPPPPVSVREFFGAFAVMLVVGAALLAFLSTEPASDSVVLALFLAVNILLLLRLYRWSIAAVRKDDRPTWRSLLRSARWLLVVNVLVAGGVVWWRVLADVPSEQLAATAFVAGALGGLALGLIMSGLIMFRTRRAWDRVEATCADA